MILSITSTSDDISLVIPHTFSNSFSDLSIPFLGDGKNHMHRSI